MKKLIDLLVIVAVLLLLYSIIGRFIGRPTVGFGVIKSQASSGILLANSLMLVVLIIKSYIK
jgi:hypothetical protein